MIRQYRELTDFHSIEIDIIIITETMKAKRNCLECVKKKRVGVESVYRRRSVVVESR